MHDIDQLNMTVMEVLECRRRSSPCDGSEEFGQTGSSRRASGTRVSYLTVPSQSSACHNWVASLPEIRSRKAAVTRTTAGNQRSDCVSRQDLGSPPLAATGGASEKPTPTFGVGKAVPRGYPSVARRTRIHLPLAELRRFSVPKAAAPVLEPTSGSGSEMRTIPTVYLPTGSEGEDGGSDLLTIPSSYMLLSVSGTTGAPSITGDNRGDTGTGYRRLSEDENETAHDLQRRGSSVSVVYSQPPRMPTMMSPVESSETRSEHLLAEADTTTVDEFPNAQTTQSSKVGDSRCTRLAANTGRPVKAPPVVNLQPIATAPEESRPALSRDGEMNGQRRFNFERPLGDRFVPPADAWSAQQGFIDPIRNIRLQMARRNPKNFDEEVVDAMSIIRDSLNRMMRKEAGLRAQSPPEMFDDAHVYPLTLASLQQGHLFADRPALGEMLDVMKGIRYPDPHFDQVDSDPHKFGIRYISPEKFDAVYEWVYSVEQFREQGLLEGELVPEADLAWSFDDDYAKGISTINSCS